MIARFSVLLPYTISIPVSAQLEAYSFDQHGYRVTIYPPCQAEIDSRQDIMDVIARIGVYDIQNKLIPRKPQEATDVFTCNGSPTVKANLIQIDFQKFEFDRREDLFAINDNLAEKGDPPAILAMEITNKFLDSIRAVTRCSRIMPLSFENALWHFRYLSDTGEVLEKQEGLIRGYTSSALSWHSIFIEDTVWKEIKARGPEYAPTSWDTLLLDAEALLPAIGAPLVLAQAALETLISTALNTLAGNSNIPADLWKWINDRGDYRKAPSLEEQFDRLLKILTGKSLKDKNDLWEGFKNLKDARNSFVHKGIALIGKKELDRTGAKKLVLKAREIADWIETFLPPDLCHPQTPELYEELHLREWLSGQGATNKNP